MATETYEPTDGRPVRDGLGRWVNGNPGGPGGHRYTLTDVLRTKANPDVLAKRLLKMSQRNPAVLMYIYDRLDGKPRGDDRLTMVDDRWVELMTRLRERIDAQLEAHERTLLP